MAGAGGTVAGPEARFRRCVRRCGAEHAGHARVPRLDWLDFLEAHRVQIGAERRRRRLVHGRRVVVEEVVFRLLLVRFGGELGGGLLGNGLHVVHHRVRNVAAHIEAHAQSLQLLRLGRIDVLHFLLALHRQILVGQSNAGNGAGLCVLVCLLFRHFVFALLGQVRLVFDFVEVSLHFGCAQAAFTGAQLVLADKLGAEAEEWSVTLVVDGRIIRLNLECTNLFTYAT